MRKYELMTIYDTKVKTLEENSNFLKETLTKNQSKIIKEKDMGERSLAYPIDDKNKGHYFLYDIESEQKSLDEIEKAFKLDKGLIRYIFVRKNK